MATEAEITRVLMILSGARLGNAPAAQEAAQVKQTWLIAMDDIPGPVLEQAVKDFIKTGEFWPRPVEIRRLAEKVRANNGASTAGGQFADPSHPRVARRGETYDVNHQPVDVSEPENPGAYRGVYAITPDGWHQVERGEWTRPAREPNEYDLAVAALAAKYDPLKTDALPTDAELAEIDALRERVEHAVHEPASLFGLPVVVRNG